MCDHFLNSYNLVYGNYFYIGPRRKWLLPTRTTCENTFVPMLHFKKATLKSFLEMYVNKLIFNFIIMIQIISKL